MGILVIEDKDEMRRWTRQRRREGQTVGFVPTMGYLHDGHLSLVSHARERCDVVVASIYVNPTQFSVSEDFGVYPSDKQGDLQKLEQAGCAVAFCPRSLYHQAAAPGGLPSDRATDGANVAGRPDDEHARGSHETWVTVTRLQRGLCGQSRPHFFRGVATVVTKLFHIVEPDVAVFGRKDYQQWRVIQRMVRDLDFAIEIVGMPICREPDGLAMSSRNARLTPDNRVKAVAISAALTCAKDGIASGTLTTADAVRREVRDRIEQYGGRVDYVEVVDAEELDPLDAIAGGSLVMVAVAAFYGDVRLIDNMECRAP